MRPPSPPAGVPGRLASPAASDGSDLDKWFAFDEICYEEAAEIDADPTRASSDSSSADGSASLTDDSGQSADLKNQESSADRHPRLASPHARRLSTRPAGKQTYPFSVVCFPANPLAPQGVKKKRKDYPDDRRKEVAQVRKQGACIRCRTRKTPCDAGTVCRNCINAAGELGPRLCVRQRLTMLRFGTADLHFLDYTRRLLENEFAKGTTHLGPVRPLYLKMNSETSPVLSVQVQDYHVSRREPWYCCWVEMAHVGIEVSYHWEESQRYALAQLVPPESLVQWAESYIEETVARGIGFELAVRHFVMCYARHAGDLPLHDLVQKVHQLNCLIMVRTALIRAVDNDGDETAASAPLHTQISYIVKTASQTLEREVLTALDTIIFSQKGIGQSNGLALWTCLWSLILIYRRLVKAYTAFQEFPCHVPQDFAGFPEYKIELGRQVYNCIVSTYSSLFRSTTPLYTDWRLETNKHLLGNDPQLLRAFTTLRTETFWYQRARIWQANPDDQLLKQVILDQEVAMDPQSRKH